MLYQYKPTGSLVEKISQHGEGVVMCIDAQDEVLYVEEEDLIPHLDATSEQARTEERLTESLKA